MSWIGNLPIRRSAERMMPAMGSWSCRCTPSNSSRHSPSEAASISFRSGSVFRGMFWNQKISPEGVTW